MSEFNLQAINDKIESYREDGLTWLQDGIKFRSVQGCEQEQQAYWMDLLKSLGMPAEYREIPDSIMQDPDYCHNEEECSYEGRYNLLSKIKGSGNGRSLIIQSHSDV
ncbi:MAG: hypothetical protein ACM3VW_11075, partial [Bacteroidota bacterium]